MGFFKKPSWKKLTGTTRARQKLARATRIPTTRRGRQQKLGRMLTGGCRRKAGMLLAAMAAIIAGAVAGTLALAGL